jgi:predicted transcriptional regulator
MPSRQSYVDRAERISSVHRLRAAGLTQRAIAHAVGCSQGSVSLWLRGLHSPWRCSGCAAELLAPAELCGFCAEAE